MGTIWATRRGIDCPCRNFGVGETPVASSNFQVNFADYLRILFQRKWWLLSLLGVSILVATLFAFTLPLRFRADMEVLVRTKYRNNPYMKQGISESQLQRIIEEVSSRLKSERRLALTVQNLRLVVKNDYCAGLRMTRNEASDREAVASAMSDMTPEELMIFVHRLETPTLGRLAGLLPIPEDPFAIVNYNDPVNTPEYSEYLINEQNDQILKQLAVALQLDRRTSDLREALCGKVMALLANGGVNNKEVSAAAVFELRKEFGALERLRQLHLLNVCGSGPLAQAAKQECAGGGGRIAQGLVFGGVGGRLFISFESVHKEGDTAIPHLICAVIYNMLVSEYYTTEEGIYRDAYRELSALQDSLKQRQLDAAQELYRLKDILFIQKAFQNMLAGGEAPAGGVSKSLTPDLLQMPQVTTHIRRINTYEERIYELQAQIDSKAAEAMQLARQLADPAQQKVRKTISPEADRSVVAELIAEKSRRESELRRLLYSATPQHPSARKLIEQISELETTIRNNSKPVVIDTLVDNPYLQDWAVRKLQLETEINSLKAEVEANRKNIVTETEEAARAPEAIQKYEALEAKNRNLQQQITATQQRLDELESRRKTDGEGSVLTSFEISRSPVPANLPYSPNRTAIILLGLAIGIMASTLVIFFIEYTDHSMRDGEEV